MTIPAGVINTALVNTDLSLVNDALAPTNYHSYSVDFTLITANGTLPADRTSFEFVPQDDCLLERMTMSAWNSSTSSRTVVATLSAVVQQGDGSLVEVPSYLLNDNPVITIISTTTNESVGTFGVATGPTGARRYFLLRGIRYKISLTFSGTAGSWVKTSVVMSLRSTWRRG